MSNKTRTNLVSMFTMLSIVFTILQSAFAMGSPLSGQTLIVVSGVLMFLNLAITAAKQYVSKLILNEATNATLYALIVTVLLGITDLLNLFNFSANTSQWVRWTLTLIVTIINALSEYLYPSALSKIGDCFGVQDTQTGLWLVDYDFATNIPTWGAERNAICFTYEQQQTILNYLNANEPGRFIGGRPSGRP